MCSVLVVEDELIIALGLETELTQAGYGVVGISSTTQAGIELLRSSRPDIAVIDFKLADGACHELAAELKRRDIPFLVISGTNVEDASEDFDGVEWLSKPVDYELLFCCLRRLKQLQASRHANSLNVVGRSSACCEPTMKNGEINAG